LDCPDILCLHAFSKPQLKRDIVSPAEETASKPREVPISQKGDLYDIATTLAAPSFRNRLMSQFVEDANRGLHVIAEKNYLPEGCYTVGELILQQLDIIETPIKEKNKHLFDTHLRNASAY